MFIKKQQQTSSQMKTYTSEIMQSYISRTLSYIFLYLLVLRIYRNYMYLHISAPCRMTYRRS